MRKERCVFCQELVNIYPAMGGRLAWAEHYMLCSAVDEATQRKARDSFAKLRHAALVERDRKRQYLLFQCDAADIPTDLDIGEYIPDGSHQN